MLALEYILIVPFACQLQSRRDEYNRALKYKSQLYIFTQQHPEPSGRAEVTQNISTAESPRLGVIL